MLHDGASFAVTNIVVVVVGRRGRRWQQKEKIGGGIDFGSSQDKGANGDDYLVAPVGFGGCNLGEEDEDEDRAANCCKPERRRRQRLNDASPSPLPPQIGTSCTKATCQHVQISVGVDTHIIPNVC